MRVHRTCIYIRKTLGNDTDGCSAECCTIAEIAADYVLAAKIKVIEKSISAFKIDRLSNEHTIYRNSV